MEESKVQSREVPSRSGEPEGADAAAPAAQPAGADAAAPAANAPSPYARLPSGRHGIAAEVVAADQRSRLCNAIAEVVAQRGWAAVRIADITTLAGVARPTFYELFDGKPACLAAAFEQIAGEAEQALAAADGCETSSGLEAALASLAELGMARPHPFSLLLLRSLGSGPEALARRSSMLSELSDAVLRQRVATRSEAGTKGRAARPSASERLLVTMLIGGAAETAARLLGHERQRELASLVTPLADWFQCYADAPPAALGPPARARTRSRSTATGGEPLFERVSTPGQRLRSGRHNLAASHVARVQRERIFDAIAATATVDGSARFVIPELADRAHVSLQTFYEQFKGSGEALIAALRVSFDGLLRVSFADCATGASWAESVANGIRRLLVCLAEEPDYARLTIVSALAIGPDALELREQAVDDLAARLRRGESEASGSAISPRRAAASRGAAASRSAAASPGAAASPITAEAIVGGIFQALHSEIVAGRTRELPRLAPLLTYFALTPYVGADAATRLARA